MLSPELANFCCSTLRSTAFCCFLLPYAYHVFAACSLQLKISMENFVRCGKLVWNSNHEQINMLVAHWADKWVFLPFILSWVEFSHSTFIYWPVDSLRKQFKSPPNSADRLCYIFGLSMISIICIRAHVEPTRSTRPLEQFLAYVYILLSSI